VSYVVTESLSWRAAPGQTIYAPATRPEQQSLMPVEAKEVFISYAHSDYDVVLDIVEKLEANNCNVWFDEEGIRGGEGWQTIMRDAIFACNSCAVFIGDKEPETWHKKEMELALNREATDKEKKFLVIPVLLDTEKYEQVRTWLSSAFLGLGSVISFKHPDPLWPLFRLYCAIKREKPDRQKFKAGNWPGAPQAQPAETPAAAADPYETHLARTKRLRDGGIIDEETYKEHVKEVLGRLLNEDLNRATAHG
jgi:hypothetical protein